MMEKKKNCKRTAKQLKETTSFLEHNNTTINGIIKTVKKKITKILKMMLNLFIYLCYLNFNYNDIPNFQPQYAQ